MLPGKTQQITHQTGTIVSHRWYPRRSYPNDVDSTLRIEVPHRILFLTVTVTDFELESRYPQDGCYDFLKIKGHKYCGSELASTGRTIYVPATGALSLDFHTDVSSQADGFLLEYQYYSKFKCGCN